MTGAATPAVPWPGPRPYTEEDHAIFFGRDAEVEKLLNEHLLVSRLTVLTGDSAAGKSSLVSAGIAPRLWKIWEQNRTETGRSATPFPLIFRNWGEYSSESFRSLFAGVAKEAVEGAEAYLKTFGRRRSYRALLPVRRWLAKENPTPFDLVVGICTRIPGPVVLLFDQFEEVLRTPKPQVVADAVRLISDIYQYEQRARVLLSLRKEHAFDLHPLEAVVGGLGPREYYLKPMRGEAASEAAIQASKAWKRPSFEFDPAAIETLIKLSRTPVSVEVETEGLPTGHPDGTPVDLLTLQCLLHEVALKALELSDDAQTARISTATIHALSGSKREEAKYARRALARWINEAVTHPARSEPRKESDARRVRRKAVLDVGDSLEGLVARCARLMVPYLASGDYKVAEGENALFTKTYQDDFARLHNRPPNERILQAKAFGWTDARTEATLRGVFNETLERLRRRNILKRYSGRCELVHDKLAGPFDAWGRERRADDWTEAVTSLIAPTGTSIAVSEAARDQRVSNAIWRGCWIAPPRSRNGGPPSLDGTQFVNCDFRGTVFADCTFRGAVFDGGRLDGILFLRCHFESDRTGRHPTSFQNINGQSFSVRQADFGKVDFVDCDIRQLLLQDSVIREPVRFRSITGTSRITAGIFQELTKRGGGRLSIEPGCELAYCSWDEPTRRAFFQGRDAPSREWESCGILNVPSLGPSSSRRRRRK